MKNLFEQIENNLFEMFQGKRLNVIAAYNRTGGEMTESCWPVYKYLISYEDQEKEKLFLVSNKNVFCHILKGSCSDENESTPLTLEFQGLPFFKMKVNKDNRQSIEDLQIACNLKTKRPVQFSPLQFIRKNAGETYAAIYKMLSELSKKQPLSGQFINDMLYVQTDNGKYQFPVTNICDTCEDEDIIRLFVDLFPYEFLKNNPLNQNIAA